MLILILIGRKKSKRAAPSRTLSCYCVQLSLKSSKDKVAANPTRVETVRQALRAAIRVKEKKHRIITPKKSREENKN